MPTYRYVVLKKLHIPDNFFDLAIGNVPFGQYKVVDKKYDRNKFLIHDYFFAKTLDKVRPGGIVAFITSKGTLDKSNPEVRKYLAQRAELLGAVRLPNKAFKSNAGTEVTSDILFLKKRDHMIVSDPDWVYLGKDGSDITMNNYFVEHPEQIVGKMEMVSGPYGMESTCTADDSQPFEEQLQESLQNINGEFDAIDPEEILTEDLEELLSADPNVKNYSFTVVGKEIYYRENSVMRPVDVSATAKERIKGMIGIRDCTRALINLQLNEYSDAAIKQKQEELSALYDGYTAKFGILNSRANRIAFDQDSSYSLICSLENLDEEGNFKEKAAIFQKRTIKQEKVVTSVDTASEALTVSLSEKAVVDLPYMSELSGKDTKEIVKELIEKLEQDIALYEQNAATSKDKFHMQVGSGVYDTRKDAGNAIIKFFQTDADGTAKIGTYLGFSMNIAFDSFNRKFVLRLKGAMNHPVEIGPDPVGNIIRLNNVLKTMPDKLAEAKDRLETLTNQLESAKIEVTKPFQQEEELAEKLKRLAELNALLNMDEKGTDALILEDDEQPAIVNSDMAVTPITSVKTKPMLKKKVVGLCL